MKVVASYSIKGGVGKTAAAVNLAYCSARDGARTLVWDLDPQGAATFYFRVKPKVKGGARSVLDGDAGLNGFIKGTDYPWLDVLPADFSNRNMDLRLREGKRPKKGLSHVLKPLALHYDHVFLDCPPSISLVSENIFEAADALLIPIVPTTLSLRTYDQLVEFVHQHGRLRGLALLPFFSLVDRRKQLHCQIQRDMAQRCPHLLSTHIPSAIEVERMGVHRQVVARFAARGRAAEAYDALWREIRERLDA